MKSLKKFWVNILDYICPQFCLGCSNEGSLFCHSCQENIKLLEVNPNPWSDKSCAIPCFVCLDYATEPTKKLLTTFKYQYLKNLAAPLGAVLAKMLWQLDIGDAVITNIPLHKSKMRQRGFDQTKELAINLANISGLPYRTLLVRQRRTLQQAKLNRVERLKNMQGAFTTLPAATAPKESTVILIDDVATTGATINAAASALQNIGYKKIIAIVLAKNDI